jgi:phenylalanyl-tRNA synthetase alpha chain
MTTIVEKTKSPFSDLGVSTGEEIAELFRQLTGLADAELQRVITDPEREEFRVRWLGRTDSIRARVKRNWLEAAPKEMRRWVGSSFNAFSEHVETAYSYVKLAGEILEADRPEDLSLPGVIRPIGSQHLLRQVFQDIEDIFVSIGFSVVEGPEIETPYYNFEALNIPEHHPVRDDMDTFYIELPPSSDGKATPGQLLLRTHTSPMQIRTMEKRKPPVRVIVPGRVYRRDNPDATHSFAFHQVEGLAVDTDITFCDFTGTIEYFVKQFFGPGVKTRFRPSYFPFTEPSVEFDVSCIFCGGSGTAASGATCGKCKGAGWIELFGAGMVDPAVYGFVGYDAKKVNGFAFGMGIDRLAMLKYGIDDLQVFFQNDARFLRQFP